MVCECSVQQSMTYDFTDHKVSGIDREEKRLIDRTDYDAKWIGRNLKRLRKEKKLTVDEVRKYLGVGSVQAVYKYESGKSYPPADAMFALMQLYEADLFDILCGRENRPAVTAVDVTRKWRRNREKQCLFYYRGYIGRRAG